MCVRMADHSERCFQCSMCTAVYHHSNGLARHYLSTHQRVWRYNQFLDVNQQELMIRREQLRRQQMSSRRRRRLMSSSGVESCTTLSRVATLREQSSVEAVTDMRIEDWDGFLDTSCMPELSSEFSPSTEAAVQTENVVVSETSSSRCDAEVMTETPMSINVSTATDSVRPTWPYSLDHRALIRFVYDRPHLSLDSIMAELLIDYPNLSPEELTLVRASACGVIWGIDFFANRVMRDVSSAMDEPTEGPDIFARLLAELQEQSVRRF